MLGTGHRSIPSCRAPHANDPNDRASQGRHDQTERAVARRVFARVVPEAIGGWPESWTWDATARRFTLRFIEDPLVTAPTLLHLPTPEDVAGGFRFTCDNRSVDATPDADGIAAIPCTGGGEHVIVAEASGS